MRRQRLIFVCALSLYEKEHHHSKRGIIEALLDGWPDTFAEQVLEMGPLDCQADMRKAMSLLK